MPHLTLRHPTALRRLVAGAVALPLAAAGVTLPAQPSSADTAPRRIVAGWIRPGEYRDAALASVTKNADLWSEVSPFWFSLSGATSYTGTHDKAAAATLKRLHIPVVPTVTESLGTPAMAGLLSNATRRRALVTTIATLVARHAYDGIDLDFERMNVGGTTAQKQRVAAVFPTFLRELKAKLGRSRVLAVDVGPRTSGTDANWRVHDYATIGAVADRVRLMTYDLHFRGGQPGAIAPLPWVKTVLGYAVRVIPRAKIEVGVPLYGYDWPQQPDGTYAPATSLGTYAKVEALRTSVGGVREWSATDAAPFFTYTDARGTFHQVWYDDAYSTSAKMTLVGSYGIRGIALWHVAGEDVRQWAAIRSYAVPRSTSVTVSAPAAVTYGSLATVRGGVRGATSRAPLPGIRVHLQQKPAGTTRWTMLATAITPATGAVRFVVRPSRTTQYRMVTDGTWTSLPGATRAVTTAVRWRVSAAFATPSVRRGAAATLRGTVAPTRAGTGVERQRLVAGRWATVARTTTSTGSFVFRFTWTTAGRYTYRVRVAGTTAYAAGATAPLALRVR